MTVDDALMEHPTDLADPVVDVDFGAAQAQRRLTTHRDLMGALPTMQTPILDIPHPLRIAACEHLVHKAVIVARIVTRIDACAPVPVLSKDLFEEVPGRRSYCSHQAASLQSVGWWVIGLFYHIPSLTSTPSAVLTRILPPPRSPLRHGDVKAIAKWKILLCGRGCQAPLPIFFFPLFFSLRAVAHGEHFSLIKTRTSTLMSRYGH